MNAFVLDAVTGKFLGVVRDQAMLDHVMSLPDEFIVWVRRPLRKV